jgi:hypothetical protein
VPNYHLENLNRNAYLDSISHIKDEKSVRFATLALNWWDRHFSWKAHGCVILSNEKNEHLSYIFYKIDRYDEYITIHNIFTPLEFRRNGYGHRLFRLVFQMAEEKNVSRFRITCVPQSLDFYMTMGFVYWGINSQGDYYCDLPLPKGGIDHVDEMVKETAPQKLAGKHLNAIISKVKGNIEQLDDVQTMVYTKHAKKLAESYLYEELMILGEKTT